MDVKVTLSPGQSVVVQESYDPAWHAWSGGKPLTIRKDAMGFMAIDAPPGVTTSRSSSSRRWRTRWAAY